MNNRLYVGNLPFSVTQEALQAYFAAVGTVSDTHIVMDRDTGRPRGFAFVTMGSDAEAQRAISELNNAVFEGRPLRVNIAEEKPRGGGGGGGGGSRGPRGGHRGW